MHKRKSSLDNRTVKKPGKNKQESGIFEQYKIAIRKKKRMSRGLKTKEVKKDERENRLKKMWTVNGCHQKGTKYPKLLDVIDSILGIHKKIFRFDT